MVKSAQRIKKSDAARIGVVIPCYREKDHILEVLKTIGPDVEMIFVIDDDCPDGTGAFVEANAADPRVVVRRNERNLGVGGATLNGYRAALDAGIDIIVKIDGDGQMDPAAIKELVRPIVEHVADYTKGNRLHRRDSARGMPPVRLFGNMALTFLSKLSSGYWNVMDPTNGFTAIHAAVVRNLPLDEIATGFFFESDMLYRLGGLDAVVCDVPMQARYGDEKSHLSIRRIFWEFLSGHIRNGWRRIIDTYFVRDPGIASLELTIGLLLAFIGGGFGGYHWWLSIHTGVPATAGTVILAAVPIIVGAQLLLAFVGHDTRRVPNHAIHPDLLRQA